MKNGSTLKRHKGLEKDLNICETSSGASDLELTGEAVGVGGDVKINGQDLVLGIGKSDVFGCIKGL